MIFLKLKLLFTFILVNDVVSYAQPLADESKVLSKLLPPVPSFAEIANKHGFKCEEYNVTTSDGYILHLFRIPGEVKRPVFLMHGVLDTADAFILREEDSLALTLARKGYDVWAGNNRGNRYSRHHVTLNPNKDTRFWNYTFHEMGTRDLPAMIDLVLDRTGQSQLSAVAHSEGTTIFYVLGATKPEYNSKIKVLASLAPIAHLQHTRGILPFLIQTAPQLNIILEDLNYQEVVGFNSNIRALIRWICEVPGTGYSLCYEGLISQLIGFDTFELGPKIFTTIIEHYPAGTSKKNLLHYAQVGRRKSFAQYDYGIGNIRQYGSRTPPEYDLSKVTFDIGLYLGANDFVSTIKDVDIIKKQLPNVVDYQILAYPLWNHFDHLYAKDLPKYLLRHVLKLLRNY
ncbi:lipase 1 [Amyelois transitella]|uniref:lipase 1 n=1 Tax=Amyelois transitella TaxID=680683 RepID=UPI00067C152E|nr:lipase 1 [Amyelois transitella]